MNIIELSIYQKELSKHELWFKKYFGIQPIYKMPNTLSFQIGNTRLNIFKSELDYKYHYCFLIPSNNIMEAVVWLNERELQPIQLEGNRVIEHSAGWNSDSVYFYDANSNVLEFIVHHNLSNHSLSKFDFDSILSINEIGLCCENIPIVNQFMEENCDSKFWKGNLNRFGTNGSPYGMILMINRVEKKTWFPTEIPTDPSPFKLKIQSNGEIYSLSYDGKSLIKE